MSDDTSTRPTGWLPRTDEQSNDRAEPALVIAWSHTDASRVGQVAMVPKGTSVLGRGEARAEDLGPRLAFGAMRGGAAPPEPLRSPGLSRQQLVIKRGDGKLTVERTGRVSLRVAGRAVDRVDVAPGDTIALTRELVLLCVLREPLGAGGAGGAAPSFAFGDADAHGFVGESDRAWMLRDELAMVARRPGHVLITGPSGAGKDLAARAIHALSPRAKGPFIARNAATLPPGIIDAELFGNARNYPNAGMRERAGLLGESDAGSLFLDEVGELPDELQAHLLRVLDDGEYHRLGEDRSRRADVRFLAATNREATSLKHDFAARMKLSLTVPGLDERLSDIPLLANATLHRLARHDASIRERFFEGESPRIDPDLVVALLEHAFTAHVRELESLLLVALGQSHDHFIAFTPGVRERIRRAVTPTKEAPSRDEIERALESASGNVSRAFRDLGLPSRDALNRLIKKLGIAVKR